MARKNQARSRNFPSGYSRFLPRSIAALEGLATVAFSKGDFEAAAKHCTKLVEVAPRSFEALVQPGSRLTGDQPARQAVQSVTIRRSNSSGRRVAHANLGTILQQQGDLAGARRANEHALQISPICLPPSGTLLWCPNGVVNSKTPRASTPVGGKSTRIGMDAWFRWGILRLQRSDYAGSVEAFESVCNIMAIG
jgi:hypothetical protein